MPGRRTLPAGETLAAALVYLSANVLFAVKFGPRVAISPAVAAAAVLAATVVIVLTVRAFWRSERAIRIVAIGFWVATAFAACALLWQVRPESLRVDRWSAVSSFWDAAFDGVFPYAARTHLDHPVSILPFLLLVYLPFYALGDPGYLQIAVLLLAVPALVARRYGTRALSAYLALLCAAPAWWWELIARSDLMSNMALVIGVIAAGRWALKMPTTRRCLLTGLMIGAVTATRAIVVIPLAIGLFGPFMRLPLSKAATLTAGATVGVFVLIGPFVAWDPHAFAANNPLLLQSGKTSMLVSLAAIALSLVAGARTHTFSESLWKSAILLWMPIAVAMGLSAAQVGWNATFYENRFDSSYFNLGLAFAIAYGAIAAARGTASPESPPPAARNQSDWDANGRRTRNR